MKIEIKDKKGNFDYNELESGTLIEYGDECLNSYGYGILLYDCDKENPIIYDLDENIYYDDVHLYKIVRVLDGKMTVEIN